MPCYIFFLVNAKSTPKAYVIRTGGALIDTNILPGLIWWLTDALQLSVGYFWTKVNTTWLTASLINDFMECAETTPTFFT